MIIRASGISGDNPVIGYHNVVTSAGVSSTTAADGYPITNVANPSTNPFWRGGVNTGNEVITITTNFDSEIDYIGIAAHNLGTIKAIFSVLSGSSPILASGVFFDDDPIIIQFQPTIISQLVLTLSHTGVDAPQIGVLYAGKLLELERSIKIDQRHMPVNLNFQSSVVGGRTEINPLGRIRLNTKTVSMAEFDHFTPDWYRSDFQAFALAAEDNPFFYAWDPDEYPYEMSYVWAIDDVRAAVHPVTQRIAAQIKMEGLASSNRGNRPLARRALLRFAGRGGMYANTIQRMLIGARLSGQGNLSPNTIQRMLIAARMSADSKMRAVVDQHTIPDGFELREDGGIELREDGGAERRE